MKAHVFLIKQMEKNDDIIEVWVHFRGEDESIEDYAEVTLYLKREELPLENLPFSKVEEIAIQKAKEFLSKTISE